jgi:hypothetical protein
LALFSLRLAARLSDAHTRRSIVTLPAEQKLGIIAMPFSTTLEQKVLIEKPTKLLLRSIIRNAVFVY